jgi:hypothetical protein
MIDNEKMEPRAKIYVFRETGFVAPRNDNSSPLKKRLQKSGIMIIVLIIVVATIVSHL